MKLPLKDPLSARYLYVSPENIVHVFMPIVSGTNIGLDNTCKAVYALQEFFDKGSNSNKKASLKGELLAYKEALESDISLLGANSELIQQKQERLSQIAVYLKVLRALEAHSELESLNRGFPSYPRPLEDMMQEQSRGNLYSMVLRPKHPDGYLRSEAANPLFTLAHDSESRGRWNMVSALQEALIKAYTPLHFESQDKASLIARVLTRLAKKEHPEDFETLRQSLKEEVKDSLAAEIDFSKDLKGGAVGKQTIDNIMMFDEDNKASPADYIDALLNACAPELFNTVETSPFNQMITAEQWSIATQFLLGITSLYCRSESKISHGNNWGIILDANPTLSASLAQALAEAQKAKTPIEEACLSWINEHAKEFGLKKPLTTQDMNAVHHDFANRYTQIKDSPHFDEFFVLDTQKEGNFVIHQGSICMSFSKFVSSPLLDVPLELTQLLEKARSQASSLGVAIPHENPLVQGEVEIDTATMDNTALTALYERINTYKDPKLKETLLAQLKLERPDFKPSIDAKQFLQHVAYGQQNKAENLLKKDAELAQELLTARKIPFTDYSGRTFKCTAYEYAYWAKDTHMCRMLERYMDDQTKAIILKRVQKIEQLVGEELFKQARGLVYTKNGQEHRSAHFDLTPLKTALKTYIDAYEQSPKQASTDWKALDALWIKVGLPQRELPAHIAQEYCHPKRSFHDAVNDLALLDADNPVNLVRQLKYYNWNTGSNDTWFTPTSYSEDSGLGFSFAIAAGRWPGVVASEYAARGLVCVDVDLSAIEAIDEVRTKDLKWSLENLAAPSNSQAPNIHGS